MYEGLGVGEYYIFDPEGRRFRPAFRAYRLVQGSYVALEPELGADDLPYFRSAAMRLELVALPNELRWRDPRGGRLLPIPREVDAEVEAATSKVERAAEAEDRARAADERAGELAAELDRLRAELGRRGGGQTRS